MKARVVTRQVVRAQVTRADGTVEKEKVVSYYHSNPLYRWFWRNLGWAL
jgi:hypothetical protein